MAYDQTTADLLAENAALRSQLSALQVDAAYLCIKPACGPNCVGCNGAISPDTKTRYAIEYARLLATGAVPGLGAIREGGG